MSNGLASFLVGLLLGLTAYAIALRLFSDIEGV